MNTNDEKTLHNMMNDSEETKLIQNEETVLLDNNEANAGGMNGSSNNANALPEGNANNNNASTGSTQGKGNNAAKVAAAAGVAAAVVGGAAYGAVHMMHHDDAQTADADEIVGTAEEAENVGDNQNGEGHEEVQGHETANGAHSVAGAPAGVHAAAASAHHGEGADYTNPSAGAHHSEADTRNASTAQHTSAHHDHTPHIAANHSGATSADVFDVESVNAIMGDEGVELIDVEARYNGHDARFVADADGRLLAGAVDLDGSGDYSDDEIMDFSDSTATIDNLMELDNVNGNDYLHEAVNIVDVSSDEPSFDVLVAEIDEEGELISIDALYNGNEAQFLADGEGNLLLGAVDENGDGDFSEDEIVDFRDTGATVADLVALDNVDGKIDDVVYAGYEEIGNDDNVEVQVVGFQDDAVINGEVVDIAAVLYDDEPMVFVDATQNGEIDLVIADFDGNGEITEDEYVIVTDEHALMPDADDVYGGSMDDDLYQANNIDYMDDYNNDANVDFFDDGGLA